MYFEEEEEADSCLLRDECSDDTNLSGKKHVYSVFRKILWENRRVLRWKSSATIDLLKEKPI